jgi:hypothetical protein
MMLQYVGYRSNYWEEQSAARHNELGFLTDLGIHRVLSLKGLFVPQAFSLFAISL